MYNIAHIFCGYTICTISKPFHTFFQYTGLPRGTVKKTIPEDDLTLTDLTKSKLSCFLFHVSLFLLHMAFFL